ncbi:MAG: hypothetical protein AB1551_00085 [Actinomycetota bacterium]
MSFDAIPRIGDESPADPTGAMGTDWILAAVNTSYALYDLEGVSKLGPASFAPFFSFPLGTWLFNPKIVYDQYSQVFVMGFLASNGSQRKSWILLVTVPNATAGDQRPGAVPRSLPIGSPAGKVEAASSATQGGGGLANPNTLWDPGDLRFVNAPHDADLGRVYAAHKAARNLRPDSNTDGYLEATVRWYELKPGGTISGSKITRTGVIGAPETDVGWPVVATDGSGNLYVSHSQASAVTGEFLSACATSIPPGGTGGRSILLASGTARMEAVVGPEPWGAYGAANRDPTSPAMVAIVSQYARSDGSGATEDWQQTFSLVSQP